MDETDGIEGNDPSSGPLAAQTPNPEMTRTHHLRRRTIIIGASIAAAVTIGSIGILAYQLIETSRELDAASSRLDDLEVRAATAEDNLDRATTVATSLDTRIAAVENELGGISGFGDLASTVGNIDRRVADLETEISGLGGSVSIGSRIDDSETRIECLDSALANVETSWRQPSIFYFGC